MILVNQYFLVEVEWAQAALREASIILNTSKQVNNQHLLTATATLLTLHIAPLLHTVSYSPWFPRQPAALPGCGSAQRHPGGGARHSH